jgi:predicted DNA-binding transcriptional regulator AlpA
LSKQDKQPEPLDDSRLMVTMTIGELRQVVSEEVRAALKNEGAHVVDKNRLLSPQQAAEILGQNVRWVYRHAGKLPFTRRINRKNLRFSEAGLRRWITLRKRDSRR